MPSARQLSITADQIDCKIAEARRRAQTAIDRFGSPISEKDAREAISDIERAFRDQKNWQTVQAAYAKLVA